MTLVGLLASTQLFASAELDAIPLELQAGGYQQVSIIFDERIQKLRDLERFLSASYVVGEYKDFISLRSITRQAEIYHYHLSNGSELPLNKRIDKQDVRLESRLVYLTASTIGGKRIHIISDFSSAVDKPKYSVVLAEGENVAVVVDYNGSFNKTHFKRKLIIHIELEKRSKKRH